MWSVRGPHLSPYGYGPIFANSCITDTLFWLRQNKHICYSGVGSSGPPPTPTRLTLWVVCGFVHILHSSRSVPTSLYYKHCGCYECVHTELLSVRTAGSAGTAALCGRGLRPLPRTLLLRPRRLRCTLLLLLKRLRCVGRLFGCGIIEFPNIHCR